MSKFKEGALFAPKGNKSLVHYYPELGEHKILKKLKSKELYFCWYYALVHYADIDTRRRIFKSFKDSYGVGADPKLRDKYLEGNFPNDVRDGIAAFENFNPTARLKARLITEKTFNSYEKILSLGVESCVKRDDAGNEYNDWTAINAFVNATQKINNELSSLISKMEEGYGVSERAAKVSNAGTIDGWHKNKQD